SPRVSPRWISNDTSRTARTSPLRVSYAIARWSTDTTGMLILPGGSVISSAPSSPLTVHRMAWVSASTLAAFATNFYRYRPSSSDNPSAIRFKPTTTIATAADAHSASQGWPDWMNL